MMMAGSCQGAAASRHPKGSAMKRNHLRKISCGILAGTILLGLAPPLEAQSQPAVKTQDRRAIRAEITPELRLAVKRGLMQLIRQQRTSKSFASEDYPVAINALMGMALLAGGYTDKTGPESYVAALKLNTSTLLRYQKKNGYIDDGDSKMYGHGFATLYLAQLYGMSASPDGALRKALERAIKLIERAQGKEGGWDYLPAGTGALTNKSANGDSSITVCQTMALRAARNLGIAIDAGVIENARRYIQRAQLKDGGFAYRIGRSSAGGSSEFPRSAAGVCILYSLGDYSSVKIRQGIVYLEKNYRDLNHFPHYAHYYCAQALFQVGGRSWKDYFSWVHRRLLKYQLTDGSWKAGLMERSAGVRTAMALIVLQLPYRFLPIHER